MILSFRFTKDSALRDLWIKSTGRRHWTPGKNTRICSKHFNENCFRKTEHKTFLKASSVPTLFIHVNKLTKLCFTHENSFIVKEIVYIFK